MKISALLHSDNRILHSFLLASGIYGLLAFSIFYVRENFTLKDVGLQNQNIAISLQQFTPNTPPQAQAIQPPMPKPTEKIKPLLKKKPKKYRKENKVLQPAPKEVVEPQIQEVATNANPAPTNTPTTPPQILTFGKNNDPILLAIKQAIDKNLYYPRKARMMRVEGMVTIEFTLLASGGVENVRVINSSGNPILDKSALRTIFDSQESFPLVQNNMIIQIPIQYYLKG